MRWFHLTVEEFEWMQSPDNASLIILELKPRTGKYQTGDSQVTSYLLSSVPPPAIISKVKLTYCLSDFMYTL